MNKKIVYILVIILLLCIFFQATISMSRKSITPDEIIHLPAGYSYIKTRDFRLNPEHPPLVKELSAMPLLLLDPKLPLDHQSWITSLYQKNWTLQLVFGQQFLFEYNKNSDQLTFLGRIPIVLLSMLLGLFVFLFSKKLYGEKAGLFALFLYSFSPNILAHSRLITTDLGISCFMFIAVYFFWKFIEKSSITNIILTGVFVGLTLLSKFTGVFIVPILLILAFFTVYYKRKDNKNIFDISIHFKKKTIQFYSLILLIIIIGLLVIPIFYFFQVKPYFTGFKDVIEHSTQGHSSFLMGEHSTQGWWYYFIIAFLIKTPIPTLIFILLTLIFYKRVKHKNTLNEIFIITPIIFIFFVFFFNNINIGLRHILPVYPFIFVFVSKITNLKINKQKIFNLLIIILSIWYLLGSLFIFPHYLAYFNEFVGGPDNGYKYLIDSNIDWGQDLKGLKHYMVKNNIKNITLGYLGEDSIDYRKISYKQIMCYPTPRIIAVSVNVLQGIKKEQAECLEWLKEYEPIAKIGYSIFIYNITNDIDEEREKIKFCKNKCIKGCREYNLEYSKSYYVGDSCECECKGAKI